MDDRLHYFSKEKDFKATSEMSVTTEIGNIRFLFSENGRKIHVPQLNVFAQLMPDSLKSLEDEIDKVMKSDKK